MKKDSTLLKIFTRNWQIKIVSLVFAIIVYILISLSNSSTRTISLNLDVIENPNYKIENTLTNKIDVDIRGNEQVIYLVDPKDLYAKLDLTDVNKTGISKVAVKLIYNGQESIEQRINFSINPSIIKVLLKDKNSE